MNNGTLIKSCEKGFLVDNKTLIEKEKAEKVLSEYFFFDYWKGEEIDAFQGELDKSATFIKVTMTDPGSLGLGANRFTYFSDMKFGAGYLKHIMLGSEFTMVTADENDEEYELHDIDKIVEIIEEHGTSEAREKIEKVKYLLSLCNRVFVEENPVKQKEYLMFAAEVYNNYIREETTRGDSMEIYDNPETAKNEILEYLYIPDERQQFLQAFSKEVWTKEDKAIIQNIIDSII